MSQSCSKLLSLFSQLWQSSHIQIAHYGKVLKRWQSVWLSHADLNFMQPHLWWLTYKHRLSDNLGRWRWLINRHWDWLSDNFLNHRCPRSWVSYHPHWRCCPQTSLQVSSHVWWEWWTIPYNMATWSNGVICRSNYEFRWYWATCWRSRVATVSVGKRILSSQVIRKSLWRWSVVNGIVVSIGHVCGRSRILLFSPTSSADTIKFINLICVFHCLAKQ